MRFDLDDSIFTSCTDVELVGLFDLGNHLQRRIMLVNDDANGEGQKWVLNQSSKLSAELQKTLSDSQVLEAIQPSTVKWLVAENTTVYPHRITVQQALYLMRSPLEIYVENQVNDSAFLLSIMRREQRTHINRCMASGTLKFVHGGGDTLSANLTTLPTDQVQNFKRLAIFDSDSLLPENPGRKSRDLLQICREKFIDSHCLTRRAAENYLTKSQIYGWVRKNGHTSQKKAKADAFFDCMNEKQRHHFRMRDGWKKDEQNLDYLASKGAIDAFYESATAHPNWYLMERGFHRGIRDTFSDSPAMDIEILREGFTSEFGPFIDLILSRL